MPQLLDKYGVPFPEQKTKAISGAGGSGLTYVQALRTLNLPSMQRANDPYVTHAYVSAAANAIALNLSQVDLQVQREGPKTRDLRAKQAVEWGYWAHGANLWPGEYGARRTFFQRHCRKKSRYYGKKLSDTTPDFNHWFYRATSRPNDLMLSQADLIYSTSLFLTLRGEAIWLPITKSGAPWMQGDEFEGIVTLHPDNLKEKVRPDGTLEYWEYTISARDSGFKIRNAFRGQQVRLMPNEIVMFKYLNPNYPLRGISRLTAAAAGIMQDLLAEQHTTSILENGAEPGGVLISEKPIPDDKERQELLASWQARYGGLNRRKIALLDGGIKYEAISLSPADMQAIEMRKWNREEILALLGVPKSIVSVDENLNYSIQISQDRNFWNKCLIPIAMLIERVCDQSALFGEPDTVGAAFDLSAVEALQGDLKEKAGTAVTLMKDGRMSAQMAYDTVGMDVEAEEGGDKVLVSGILTPISDILNPPDISIEPNPPKPQLPAPKDKPKTIKLRDPRTRFLLPGKISRLLKNHGMTREEFAKGVRSRNPAVMAKYSRAIDHFARPLKRKWLRHVQSLRAEVMANFKAIAKAVTKAEPDLTDVDRLIFSVDAANKALLAKFRPEYMQMMADAAETVGEELGGLFVFDISSKRGLELLQQRMSKVTGVNDTLRRNLSESISQAVKNGENWGTIRERIDLAFSHAISASKATTIARTEVAQAFSAVRTAAFEDEGVTEVEWSTAGDEKVRDDHVMFGLSGPHKLGFNFMELVGGEGSLTAPSDPDGPADQVINCRCVLIPVG